VCDNGLWHRPTIGACPSQLPRAEPVSLHPGVEESVDAGYGYQIECRQDSDCNERPHGRCDWFASDVEGTWCSYGCTVDADCAFGTICTCSSDLIGHCAPALCKQDSDCPDGLLCGGSGSGDICYGSGQLSFVCQTPADTCAVDGDCPAGYSCVPMDDGAGRLTRSCVQSVCSVPGRPFLVDGRERLAEVRDRNDWCASSLGTADAPSLAPDMRGDVVHGWIEQGLMEHASVAAFARFALQLAS
jgi:hypothetical protein